MDNEFYADLIAAPYKRGAKGENGKYDCYRLLQELYKRLGIELEDQPRARKRQDMEKLIARDLPNWKPVLPVDGDSATVIESCNVMDEQRYYALRPYSAIQLAVRGHYCHVGMVLPDNQVIHTWENSGCVIIERLDDATWQNKIVGVYRPCHTK